MPVIFYGDKLLIFIENKWNCYRIDWVLSFEIIVKRVRAAYITFIVHKLTKAFKIGFFTFYILATAFFILLINYTGTETHDTFFTSS